MAAVAVFAPRGATGEEVRLLYEVVGGAYVEVGGFVGSWGYELPNDGFAFLGLTIDTDSDTGTLQRYGANLVPLSGFLSDPIGDEVFRNRQIVGNRIRFTQSVPHPYGSFVPKMGVLSVAVSFSETSIRFDFSASYPIICCDIPYLFSFTGVQGVAMPIDFGDANRDHTTDLFDLESIVECVVGPGFEVDPVCDFVDGNGDLQVDLIDVALMQRTWNPSAPR